MKLSTIKINPDNPRIIKDDQFEKLKQSIREFPKMMELRPIIIDSNGIIIAGNMRYRALIDLGFKDIPDSWVKKADDLTPEELERFIIVDNVAFGQFDWDLLANDWDTEKLSDWGLEIPGFEAPIDMIGNDDQLNNVNYGDKKSGNLVPFTILDIGGLIDRAIALRLVEYLKNLGAIPGEDNREILEKMINEKILHT